MSMTKGMKAAVENARIAREHGEHVSDSQVRAAAARMDRLSKAREENYDAGGEGLHKGHAEAAARKRGKMISLAGCTWPPARKNGPDCGRFVWRNGKFVRVETVKPVKNDAPAVHDDRLYAGWNPALRMHIRSRTQEREEVKKRGWRPLFG